MMDDTEEDHRLKDAARAAALLLDAVESAPDRALTTVETAFGSAFVVVDGPAVDVDLDDREATVHIRRDEGSDPEGRGR
jgi:hypothetical protein